MNSPIIIEGENLSCAWAKAFLTTIQSSKVLANVTVSFMVHEETDERSSSNNEILSIREAVDQNLQRINEKSISTVANTIFPLSFWNPATSSDDMYERFVNSWTRIKRTPANRNGTYFQRMIAAGLEMNNQNNGVVPFNQLEHVISAINNNVRRRSAHFMSITNPHIDHSNQPFQGFPCMQHVHFVIDDNWEKFAVTGLYSNQNVLEKAYGNYLGLYRLGVFVAHETGLKLVRINCNASRLKFSQNQTKSSLENLKATATSFVPSTD